MNTKPIFALTLSLLLPLSSRAGQGNGLAKARRLYREGDWEAIVKGFPDQPRLPSQLEYYRGMALARLGRLNEAREAFIEGLRQDPRNEAFPLELAGIAFKQKHYSEAKSWLIKALRLDPGDAYAREFLATVYFLEHNLDAAIDNWNRIGEPHVRDVTVDPPVRLNPELLSRCFTFSPASTLLLKELRTTRARLGQLGVFSQYRFSLLPASGGDSKDFNLRFSAFERNGLGQGKWQSLLLLLRGLPYETIYPDYFNIHREAMNFTSLFRWDDQKRRVMVGFSAPWHGDPKWHYRAYFDGRNENWNVAGTFHGAGPPLTDLNMRRGEAGVEITSVESGRWSWMMGAAAARRTFRNFTATSQTANAEFANSTSLEYRAGGNYLMIDRPEKRFTLDSSISAQIGRVFGRSPGRYERLEGTFTTRWYPKAEGDDYGISEAIHVGAASGDVPFDDLFMLGLERGNNLPLRAHIGTLNGRKGNAPLGRRYFLSNWEVDKQVYSNGWISLTVAPYIDTGRITDNTGLFGERGWLWDAGGELKARILGGPTIILTYGKNLRTGQNTFYTAVPR